MPDTFNLPVYASAYSGIGVYGPNASVNHSMTAPYTSLKNDEVFEVATGWISIPVAYNNSANPDAPDSVRIKLHNTQYHKIIDYQATRMVRPPMVPEMENTDKKTMNPLTLLPDSATGQQAPVLEGMTYGVSAPVSTGQGETAAFSTMAKMRYSVGKEKLFLEGSDMAGPNFVAAAKLAYRPKSPTDGNTLRVVANVLPEYTYNTYVGPGYLEGAKVSSGFGANTVAAADATYNLSPDQKRYADDPYKGVV